MASACSGSPITKEKTSSSCKLDLEHMEDNKKKTEESTKVQKKKKSSLTINLTNCKYDSVCRVAKRFGMRVVNDDEEWTIYWTDMALPDRVCEMKSYQKVNHFPGMNEICRKDMLARNMNRMLKLFPKEYNCFPRTWTLPADYGDFQSYFQAKKNKMFIAKPGSGCQGKGIFLFRSLKDIRPGEHIVCQQYISKPFLIDGFKFDLRIYVLVTSCDPLRVYVYKDGLVRLGTLKYKEPTGGNMDELCMHLTNYAINKHSKDFVIDEETGSKRRITTMNRWFEENGYNLQKIWDNIDDVIIKTLIAAHPIVRHNYRSSFPNHTRGSACFEILGFDILLDKKLKPWLMEVNRSPSFHTDAQLDKEVKEGLLSDTLNLLDLYANDRRRCMEEEKKRVRDRLLCKQRSKETNLQQDEARASYEAHFESYEQKHLGGFRRIYTKNGNEEKYEKYFNQSTSLCSETAASRARADLAKQLREELQSKQKEFEKYMKKDTPNKPKTDQNNTSESPPRDRKISSDISRKSSALSSAVAKRRTMSFRLCVPTNIRKEEESTCSCCLGQMDCGNRVTSPQNISEEEELQRLAGLQVRESLIRGMGVSEQLRTMLESQPSSRIQTPLPPKEGAPNPHQGESNQFFSQAFVQESPRTYGDPDSTISQPFLHISHPPLPCDKSFIAYSSPDHRGGIPSGTTLHQLPGYRLHRPKVSFPTLGRNNVGVYGKAWETNSPQAVGTYDHTPWRRTSFHHQPPPSLELCGFAISPAPPKGGGRRMSHMLSGRSHISYDNRYGINQGLSVRGLSVSDRLRQLKYLSTSPFLQT